VDTACSRLRDAYLAAPEYQLAHIVSVPVSPPVGLDLALGAAEQRAVRLESFPQLLQPSGEQEVAQGKPCVQDGPPKQQLAARGRGQRGKDGIRDRCFRAILLHDGGSSFWQPNDVIGLRTTVNFQRSEGQPLIPTERTLGVHRSQ